MNKFDRMYYEHFFKDYNQRLVTKDEVFELADWFFRGNQPASETVIPMITPDFSKLIQMGTRNNILRSIHTTKALISSVMTEMKSKDEARRKTNELINSSRHSKYEHTEEMSDEERQQLVEAIAGQEGVRQALIEANEEADAMSQMVGVGNDEGSIEPISIQEAKEVFQLVNGNRHVKNLLHWFGIFSAHISKLKRMNRVPDFSARQEVVLGNNLKALHPANYLLLDPDFEDYFNYLYINRQLLQFDPSSIKETGKGDVVLLIDSSGSMLESSGLGASRQVVMTGLLLAMVKSLMDDGRNAHIYSFSYSTVKVSDTNGKKFIDVLADVSKSYGGGGTNIEGALLSVWDNHPEEDIIVLTDEEFLNFNNKQYLEEKKGDNRLWAMTTPTRSQASSDFTDLADGHSVLNNLESAKDFCQHILK